MELVENYFVLNNQETFLVVCTKYTSLKFYCFRESNGTSGMLRSTGNELDISINALICIHLKGSYRSLVQCRCNGVFNCSTS